MLSPDRLRLSSWWTLVVSASGKGKQIRSNDLQTSGDTVNLNPPAIRTFICIEIPPEEQAGIAAVQRQFQGISGVRWSRPESMHPTLRFMGSLSPDEVERLKDGVRTASVRRRSFEITAGTVGAFPNDRRPKIVWVGLTKGSEEINRVYRDLNFALEKQGFGPDEARDFTPHVTLARVRQEISRDDVRELTDRLRQVTQRQTPIATFKAEAVTVMHSRLTREGSVYTPAAVVPFC